MESKAKLISIILLDDNDVTNFIHTKIITDLNLDYNVRSFTSGSNLINFLSSRKEPSAELFFIDMNMPDLNAWEFLDAYALLPSYQKNKNSIFVLLSTSLRDEQIEQAKIHPLIKHIILKPLSKEKINTILH